MQFIAYRLLLSAHEKIRYLGIYFHRNFITTAKHVVIVDAIKYLGKYMTICLTEEPFELGSYLAHKLCPSVDDLISFWQNSVNI